MTKYESPWGIINKFMLANNINGKLAAEHIANTYSRKLDTNWYKKLSSGVISNYLFSDTASWPEDKKMIQYGQEIINELLNQLLKYQNRYYSSENICTSLITQSLKICPECMKEGNHFIYNQFVFIDKCPIHDIELLDKCPHCNNRIDYEIMFRNDRLPFQCTNCKEFFVNNNFVNLIDRWNQRNKSCDLQFIPFNMYKKVIPILISTNLEDCTNDKTIIQTLNEMFLNKPINTIPKNCNDIDSIVNSIRFENENKICKIIFGNILSYYKDLVIKTKIFNNKNNEIGKINAYRKLCYKYKLVSDMDLNNLVSKYFNLEGLIYYFWIRDMECHFTKYKNYYLDENNNCNTIDYNYDILKILKRTNLTLINNVPHYVITKILADISYLLIQHKYTLWIEYTNRLVNIYSPYEILGIMDGVNLNNKTYYKDFLLVINKNDYEYKIYCE